MTWSGIIIVAVCVAATAYILCLVYVGYAVHNAPVMPDDYDNDKWNYDT